VKLSIIIPVYNEKKTIEEILRWVMAVRLPKVEKEIIIVDDKSTDGTREILGKIKKKHPLTDISEIKEEGDGWAFLNPSEIWKETEEWYLTK